MENLLNKEIIRCGLDDNELLRKTHSVVLDPTLILNLLNQNVGIRNYGPRDRAETHDIVLPNFTDQIGQK